MLGCSAEVLSTSPLYPNTSLFTSSLLQAMRYPIVPMVLRQLENRGKPPPWISSFIFGYASPAGRSSATPPATGNPSE